MILTPEQIQKPRTPFRIESGATEKDWHDGQELLGGVNDREIFCPDRDWTKYITEYELQRNNNFDSYTCVIQAYWNGLQCIAKRKYNITLDESKRYTAIKAGCVPRRGSNVNTVGETIRTKDSVPESVYPTMTPTMTEAQFYQDLPNLDKYFNFLKEGWEMNHEWVAKASPWVAYSKPVDVYNALIYSPVVVSVDGDYRFNGEGELMYGTGYDGSYIQYTHDVLVVKADWDSTNSCIKCFYVLDSENPTGIMKVSASYKFGYCKLLYLKKKSMFQLKKETGKPAVYLFCEQSGNYYAIADSEEIPGGDLLKTFSGTYKNASILSVDSIPQDKVVGEVKAIKK